VKLDSLTAPQAAASAALIRWLLEQYQIRAQISLATIFDPVIAGQVERVALMNCSVLVHSQSTFAAW